MKKILIVDDSATQAARLRSILDDEYDVSVAQTAEEGLRRILEESFSLVLLDVVMPGMDGFTLLKKLQEEAATWDVPVIMITSLSDAEHEQRGLVLGAVDYITKPFRLNELLSRIKALLRRSAGFSKAVFLEANGIKVDVVERRAWKDGSLLALPLVEFRLLCLLMRNPNHLLTREAILDSLWDGAGNYVDDNTLSVYVRRLRNKIEETPNAPRYLLTERGIGYKWVVE